jgi:hypothetical protein
MTSSLGFSCSSGPQARQHIAGPHTPQLPASQIKRHLAGERGIGCRQEWLRIGAVNESKMTGRLWTGRFFGRSHVAIFLPVIFLSDDSETDGRKIHRLAGFSQIKDGVAGRLNKSA